MWRFLNINVTLSLCVCVLATQHCVFKLYLYFTTSISFKATYTYISPKCQDSQTKGKVVSLVVKYKSNFSITIQPEIQIEHNIITSTYVYRGLQL